MVPLLAGGWLTIDAALESLGVVMNEWRFEVEGERVIRVEPAMVCDDGALLRQWALNGQA